MAQAGPEPMAESKRPQLPGVRVRRRLRTSVHGGGGLADESERAPAASPPLRGRSGDDGAGGAEGLGWRRFSDRALHGSLRRQRGPAMGQHPTPPPIRQRGSVPRWPLSACPPLAPRRSRPGPPLARRAEGRFRAPSKQPSAPGAPRDSDGDGFPTQTRALHGPARRDKPRRPRAAELSAAVGTHSEARVPVGT